MSARSAALRRTANTFFGRGLIVPACVAVLAVLVVATIFAGLLAPYDPNLQDLPGALEPPGGAHLFGQDNLGRDILSRLVYGGRISLSVSVLSGTFAAAIGTTIGLAAGYFGGMPGRLAIAATDVMLSIPNLVLSLVLVAITGGGLLNIVVAIGLGMVPTYIRVVNGLVLALRENDYVLAARLIGRRDWAILVRHLLPNSFPTLIVLYTINLGNAVLTESTLSYLGVGIAPPTASWGSMVADVYPFLIGAPWLVLAPGLCIVATILALNITGDALRDAFDPRLRGRI